MNAQAKLIQNYWRQHAEKNLVKKIQKAPSKEQQLASLGLSSTPQNGNFDGANDDNLGDLRVRY